MFCEPTLSILQQQRKLSSVEHDLLITGPNLILILLSLPACASWLIFKLTSVHAPLNIMYVDHLTKINRTWPSELRIFSVNVTQIFDGNIAQPEPLPILVNTSAITWIEKAHADLYTVSRCHARGESEDHTGEKACKGSTLAWKLRANITRSPKQGYQCPHEKDLSPPKNIFKNKNKKKIWHGFSETLGGIALFPQCVVPTRGHQVPRVIDFVSS